MSENFVTPEPEHRKRSFIRVIGSKIKAGARRVASLTHRGATTTAHGATLGLDWAAKLVRLASYVVLLTAATLVVLAFVAVMAAVMLVSRVVYLVVLIVRTPHLALFHREALRTDWSIFVAGLHPRRLMLLTPTTILADTQPRATVHDILAHRKGNLDRLVAPYTRLVTDVDAAHEAALFEELDRRKTVKAPKVERVEEAPKGRPTPKQAKRRPTRLPRTA